MKKTSLKSSHLLRRCRQVIVRNAIIKVYDMSLHRTTCWCRLHIGRAPKLRCLCFGCCVYCLSVQEVSEIAGSYRVNEKRRESQASCPIVCTGAYLTCVVPFDGVNEPITCRGSVRVDVGSEGARVCANCKHMIVRLGDFLQNSPFSIRARHLRQLLPHHY